MSNRKSSSFFIIAFYLIPSVHYNQQFHHHHHCVGFNFIKLSLFLHPNNNNKNKSEWDVPSKEFDICLFKHWDLQIFIRRKLKLYIYWHSIKERWRWREMKIWWLKESAVNDKKSSSRQTRRESAKKRGEGEEKKKVKIFKLYHLSLRHQKMMKDKLLMFGLIIIISMKMKKFFVKVKILLTLRQKEVEEWKKKISHFSHFQKPGMETFWLFMKHETRRDLIFNWIYYHFSHFISRN